MLEIDRISKTFNANTVNQKIALDHLSLTLKDGDFVTVIGGNGAGKSTMCLWRARCSPSCPFWWYTC